MIRAETSDSLLIVHLPIAPVPASRPRIPRFGKPYYTGRYKTFRETFGPLLRQELNAIRHEPYDFPIQVLLEFGCKTPKNPANDYPVGDIDNYAKAVLDSCNGAVFIDDKLIVDMWGSKYYSEDPHIHIEVHDGR